MPTRAWRKSSGRRRRSRATPSVVFVDDCKWNAFHQLAPGLRRAGVRTIRVSTEGLRKTKITSRLLFDRYVPVPNQFDRRALKAVLTQENVVDVQFAESLADMVREHVDLLKPEVADQIRRRLAVVDKIVASRLFALEGVRTPAMVPVGESSPEAVAERFGFPVVVKEAIGFGGEQVTIAQNAAELAAAVVGGDRGPGALFYEEFVTGTKLDYAAAMGPGGIEQELAYAVTRWLLPVGRATDVETIDDPQLVEFGRKAVAASGCTGLVNMDVIRDGQGLDWLIDFNPRAFGGSGSFRAAGIDTTEGYLRGIGERAAPVSRSGPRTGVQIHVFPTCLEEVIATGSIIRTSKAFVIASFPYLRWLGWRYWLSEAFSTADSLRRVRQDKRASRGAPRAPVNAGSGAPVVPEVPAR